MNRDFLKIKYSTAQCLMLLFPFLEPDTFRLSTSFHMFLRAWAVLAIVYMFLYYVKSQIKPCFGILIMTIYSIWLCYVSTLSIGNLQTTITQVVPILGISIWADIYSRKNGGISVAIKLIMTYVYINLLTLLLFPNGLYQSQSYQAVPYKCYFLGYRNVQSLWLLPALALTLWENYTETDELTHKTKVRLAAILLSIILIKSSTTYVATAVLLGVLIFLVKGSRKHYLWEFVNLSTVYIGSIAVSAGLVFFNIQYKFSYLIENVLHKDVDLTDRIYVWEKVLVYIRQRIWTGYGYIFDPTSRALIGASHPHNYALNLLYTGGVVGFVLVSILWLIVGYRTKRMLNDWAVRALFAGALVLLLIGLTEPLKQLPTAYMILFILYHEDSRLKGGEE